MVQTLVENRRFASLVEGAVDLDPLKTFLQIFGELFPIFAFTAAHHRREQIQPRAFGQRQHAVDHLRDGLALDRQSGRGRVGHTDPRPQQAHVVVDLGDGADRRARIRRGGLLLDRDRGREAVDLVDIRLLHHLEELARIGRQALDIAPLALRIDGVERERGLAEPDSPVNTTSRSRGISRSTFLRLCSRAPRIEIARIARLALCWRFALITSSISAFPDRHVQARQMRCVRGRIAGDLRSDAKWVSSEHRKNGN